jgi:hypothetical protein
MRVIALFARLTNTNLYGRWMVVVVSIGVDAKVSYPNATATRTQLTTIEAEVEWGWEAQYPRSPATVFVRGQVRRPLGRFGPRAGSPSESKTVSQ